jgi:hypothetical protein
MNHVSGLLAADQNSDSRWTPYQQVYGRYLFKGSIEDSKDKEIKAQRKKEEAEPQNYSFLDLLAPAGKREEH